MSGAKSFGPSRVVAIRGVGENANPIASINLRPDLPEGQYALDVAAFGYASDAVPTPGNYYPIRALSATLAEEQDARGSLYSTPPLSTVTASVPAAATQASATRAGVAQRFIVIQSISARLIIPSTVNQPILTLQLNGVDIARFGLGAAAAGDVVQTFNLENIAVLGAAEGADATVRFSAAGVAGTLQSVMFTSYLSR